MRGGRKRRTGSNQHVSLHGDTRRELYMHALAHLLAPYNLGSLGDGMSHLRPSRVHIRLSVSHVSVSLHLLRIPCAEAPTRWLSPPLALVHFGTPCVGGLASM